MHLVAGEESLHVLLGDPLSLQKLEDVFGVPHRLQLVLLLLEALQLPPRGLPSGLHLLPELGDLAPDIPGVPRLRPTLGQLLCHVGHLPGHLLEELLLHLRGTFFDRVHAKLVRPLLRSLVAGLAANGHHPVRLLHLRRHPPEQLLHRGHVAGVGGVRLAGAHAGLDPVLILAVDLVEARVVQVVVGFLAGAARHRPADHPR
mmetsp:Transcript_89863/g.254653  ORF Transcript_89863/g.254653 Transcript_89863/m.254653 type:complete len:202 (+) Transcript_89863:672-1277(+)